MFIQCCNTVILIGQVADPPSVSATKSGSTKLFIRLKTVDTYTYQGETRERRTFIPVVIWGKAAEEAAGAIQAGTCVHVVGCLESYRKAEGEPWRLQVKASQMSPVGLGDVGPAGAAPKPAAERFPTPKRAPAVDAFADDQIPF